jgi:hypothetical protein
MPAQDIYHNAVKNALIKDNWTITHDPLRLQWGSKDLYIDLGAEQLLAAEKVGQKIAVEIKSFVGPSVVADLEQALGSIFCIMISWPRRNQTEFYILLFERSSLMIYLRNLSEEFC